MSKTVVITGASRGIGMLASKELAAQGHRVFASMRDIEGKNQQARQELLAWASSLGLNLEVVEIDVTNETSVSNAIKEIEEKSPIDVLVNNAGSMPVGVTEAFDEDQVRACMDVNFYGVVRTSRAVLPHMKRRRGGKLIHVSSTAGRLAIPFFGVYCASKWAMEAYCETLQYEIQDFNIQSSIVEPSGHATDLVKTAPQPADLERLELYGSLAKGGERLLNMFETMFAEQETITDAQNVADLICRLTNAETDLPLRACVGQDMGVEPINLVAAAQQSDLLHNLRDVYAPEVSNHD